MNIRQKLRKMPLLFRSKIGIFDIFFKRLYEESFEDLQRNCKTLWHGRTSWEPWKFITKKNDFFIKFLTIVIWNLENVKTNKLKNSILAAVAGYK